MKKSEMKVKMEAQRKECLNPPPKRYTIIKCKSKKYSTGGCTCCWYCEECGRSGCDNLYFLRKEDSVEYVDCDLKEG
jgi:hypothetical protein